MGWTRASARSVELEGPGVLQPERQGFREHPLIGADGSHALGVW